MSRNDEAEEIRWRLDDNLEALLDYYYAGWVKRGNKAYLTPKNTKQLGSFQVNLFGPRRGQWYRFSQEVGGGTVELISYCLTNGTKAYDIAFREARAFLGMSNERAADDEEARARRTRERAEAERRRRRQAEDEEKRRRRRALTAAEVWDDCTPIAGTLAERYLNARGIPTPPDGWPDVVGFHPGLEWELGAEFDDGRKVSDGPVFPCLVGRVQDVTDETIAVWRIFLDPQSAKKAPVDKPKLGLGPAKGGAIRIGGVASKIGTAEGIETAFGAWWLIGRKHPVWAALSTSGVAGLELPLLVKSLVGFPDGDRPIRRQAGEYVAADGGAGIMAFRALRQRLQPTGVECAIQPEPLPDNDYLDIWRTVSALERA